MTANSTEIEQRHLDHLRGAATGLQEGLMLVQDCLSDQQAAGVSFEGLPEQAQALYVAIRGFREWLAAARPVVICLNEFSIKTDLT